MGLEVELFLFEMLQKCCWSAFSWFDFIISLNQRAFIRIPFSKLIDFQSTKHIFDRDLFLMLVELNFFGLLF